MFLCHVLFCAPVKTAGRNGEMWTELKSKKATDGQRVTDKDMDLKTLLSLCVCVCLSSSTDQLVISVP